MPQTFQLKLPTDLLAEIEGYLKVEQLSLGDFILWALSEKVGEIRERRHVKNLEHLDLIRASPPIQKPKPIELPSPPREPMKLLKAVEVAKLLVISKSAAYRMMQQGEIPVVRFRRMVRVRQEDLDRYIKEHRLERG